MTKDQIQNGGFIVYFLGKFLPFISFIKSIFNIGIMYMFQGISLVT